MNETPNFGNLLSLIWKVDIGTEFDPLESLAFALFSTENRNGKKL